jgi:glycerophosphoryl diester phosphodiesterase
MSARHRHLTATAVLAAAIVPAGVAAANGHHDPHEPLLTGRAVLPVETYADGPTSGNVPPGTPDKDGKINGIKFPTPSQPVEGFSSIIEGRRHGEYLAMPDNGYGGKAGSKDFNIRAYYIRPDFKTRRGGSGTVQVGDYIEFTDPDKVIGFPIVNEASTDRVLTGGDIDPESLQRDKDGSLWVGDEFGPWILHFDAEGRLLDAPFSLPDELVPGGLLMSPNNPHLPANTSATVPNSGGFEGMAMSPNGRFLYPILEKRLDRDPAGTRRVYEFDIRAGAFTKVATYATTPDATGADSHFVADAQMLDPHRMLLIERDGGKGLTALFRSVYEVDLRRVDDTRSLVKTEVVNLAKIPDPDGVSLPAIHTGDVGLGDPFQVTCESIEALRIISSHRLLLGCDNNFPNAGRNPGLADDNEFITVRIP